MKTSTDPAHGKFSASTTHRPCFETKRSLAPTLARWRFASLTADP